MGWFDHLLMIWGGFHDYFWPLAYWYVTVTYTVIIICIPSNLEAKWRSAFIGLWLIALTAFSTLTEINTRYILFGALFYPLGWTEITTLVFYFDVHLLGTFIATLHWNSRFCIKD